VVRLHEARAAAATIESAKVAFSVDEVHLPED
jgi:hypothetical protein